MIKWLNFTLLILCVFALAGVYVVKYKTLELANEKKALIADINAKQGDLSLLKADWAYLNQPMNIEKIVIRHKDILGLKIIEQKQFININDLPYRPQIKNDAALTALFEALENGIDPIAVLIEANE